MARNQEKAQSMLSRFRATQDAEAGLGPQKRPNIASECTNLQHCEKWRRELVHDIANKVQKIQTISGVDPWQIRDLNDQINKLMR